MDTPAAVSTLSALSHEGRLSIFRELVQAGPDGLAAGEIARRLRIVPNTLSASLNILSHAGLVASRRDGRSIIYRADYGRMGALLTFLLQDCCQGHPDICAPVTGIAAGVPCCDATATPMTGEPD